MMMLTQFLIAPLALVYLGEGSCPRTCIQDGLSYPEQCSESGTYYEGCSDAAARVAEQAGFEVVFVGPGEPDPVLFARAKVWIQPGGTSRLASQTMSNELKASIVRLVADGGGYVGFCAGGFLAAQTFHGAHQGLGLFSGRSELYRAIPDAPASIAVDWQGESRVLYWEGGPLFEADPAVDIEVLATYPDGSNAAVRQSFGRGRVVITGPHPEAGESWIAALPPSSLAVDPKANEIAGELMQWAASLDGSTSAQ
jgi:dienelactone hydrolase